jgi:hypothetical protein
MERSSIVEVLDDETIDWTGPWGEFVDANSDGMTFEELQAIGETLARGETYHGGGGALATFQLRRAA